MAYYDDDGNELFPELRPLPMLCLSCRSYEQSDFMEQVFCNLNRLDQKEEPEFYCGAWRPAQLTVRCDRSDLN